MTRCVSVLALSLALSVSLSAQPVDYSSLPPFEDGRIYSVTGEQLNRLRMDLIESAKQAETASMSFAQFRQQTLLVELGLSAIAVGSTAAAVYFAARAAR